MPLIEVTASSMSAYYNGTFKNSHALWTKNRCRQKRSKPINSAIIKALSRAKTQTLRGVCQYRDTAHIKSDTQGDTDVTVEMDWKQSDIKDRKTQAKRKNLVKWVPDCHGRVTVWNSSSLWLLKGADTHGCLKRPINGAVNRNCTQIKETVFTST